VSPVRESGRSVDADIDAAGPIQCFTSLASNWQGSQAIQQVLGNFSASSGMTGAL
jgi:hypothetical protein